MSTQPTITSFFGSRKRRATDTFSKNAKLFKGDPSLTEPKSSNNQEGSDLKPEKKATSDGFLGAGDIVRISEHTTPRKKTCDIRSFLTSKSPYRPECSPVVTPVKYVQLDAKSRSESTPVKTPDFSILKRIVDTPQSFAKKSIRFDEATIAKPAASSSVSDPVDTDDLIKAANELVEKLKNKNRTLSAQVAENKQPKATSSAQLKRKLAKSTKLAELKSSLSRLGKQTNALLFLEKKRAEAPKLTKFDSIEVEVQKSPHKGALSSPIKSPIKPAYERFAHLARRTPPAAALPLPFGFQRLLELFTAADTVSSMMMNRGELITFKKLKPAVQELSRKNFTERHLAQFLAVLPNLYAVRIDKVRNFGSTSKGDIFDLVLTPVLHVTPKAENNKAGVDATDGNVMRSMDLKKMTPKMMASRKSDFQAALLARTMDKHEEFLSTLDPPITLCRNQLTRWHPNFPLDLVPDVPPATLPEPPNMEKATSARDILERAHNLLSSNDRVRNALDVAARISEIEKKTTVSVVPTLLDQETKQRIEQKVAVHDPLKGVSKSLLEKIRAKQAAKALEAMKMSPSDEKELMLLTQLPDTARIVRTLFIDGQKGVFPWETVVEKIQFSNRRTIGKGEVECVLRRLVQELPEWLSVFFIKNIEYLKSDRAAKFTPLMERLEKMVTDKRRQIS